MPADRLLGRVRSLSIQLAGDRQPSAAPATSAHLAGHKFNITRISLSGIDEPIAAATSPAVVFTPTQLQADTGCNGITGDYAITDDQMTVTNAVQTTRGCLPPEIGTQEVRIAQAVEGPLY